MLLPLLRLDASMRSCQLTVRGDLPNGRSSGAWATRPGGPSSSAWPTAPSRRRARQRAARQPTRRVAAPQGAEGRRARHRPADSTRRIYRLDPAGSARCAAISTTSGTKPWPASRLPSSNKRRRTNEHASIGHLRPHSIVVDAPIERAFSVFTDGFGSFKPPRAQPAAGRHRRDRVRAARRRQYLRPRRRRERMPLGARARIRAAEPGRVQLGHQSALADRDRSGQDQRSRGAFIAETPERTRVELEHRNLDRHGDGWEGVREGVHGDQGWPLYLDKFAGQVSA